MPNGPQRKSTGGKRTSRADATPRLRLARVPGEPATSAYAGLLGLRASTPADLQAQVKAGVAYKAWDRFLDATTLSSAAAAELVQISPRTLARRRDEGRLQPDESDRLVRAARVYAHAIALFDGDRTAAGQWLFAPQAALGNATPIEYASTEVGAREVERLITQIEHGIIS